MPTLRGSPQRFPWIFVFILDCRFQITAADALVELQSFRGNAMALHAV